MYPAPEGYIWVCCARKRDIQWDMMRKWRNESATKQYNKLKAMFERGSLDDNFHGTITEKGIMNWGELIYTPEMTLEDYLNKYGIPNSWKYPLSVYSIFEDEDYKDEQSAVYDEETQKYIPIEWQRTVDEFIDDADDDIVFVGIDYHI